MATLMRGRCSPSEASADSIAGAFCLDPSRDPEELRCGADSFDVRWIDRRVLHGVSGQCAAIPDQMTEQHQFRIGHRRACADIRQTPAGCEVGTELEILDANPTRHREERMVGAGIDGPS